MYLFDPRKNKLVDTDNPMLILVDAMIRVGVVKPTKQFWNKMMPLIDLGDEKVDKVEINAKVVRFNGKRVVG